MRKLFVARALEYVVGGSYGVYVVPRDNVKTIGYVGRNLVRVANTSLVNEKGDHWYVFHIYNSPTGPVCEFYDSFAKSPNFYDILHPYPVIWFNSVPNQTELSPLFSVLCI